MSDPLSPRMRIHLRRAGWLLFLAASALALVAAGRAMPALPTRLGDVGPWLDREGTAVGVMAVLRVMALVGVGYLAVLTALVLAEQRRGGPRRPSRTSGILRPAVARVLRTGLATSVSLSLGPATAGATTPSEPELPVVTAEPSDGDGADAGEVAVMVPLPRSTGAREQPASEPERTDIPVPRVAASTSTSTSTTSMPMTEREPPAGSGAPPETAPAPAPDAGPTAVMRSLDDGAAPLSSPPPPVATGRSPEEDGWTVELGDHLWAIAAEVVGERGGAPDDGDVARYWEQLIAANRDRLVDPSNPDLLFPGQELVLPAVSDG